MKIGIIGTGNVGNALGKGWASKGHTILFGTRQPESEKVQKLLAEIGERGTAVSIPDAIQQANIIVLATPWNAAAEVASSVSDWQGKIVIDTTNPYRWNEEEGLTRMVGETVSGVATLQKLMPGARLVKAYSSFRPDALRQLAKQPMEKRLAVAIASNDENDKELVAQLVNDSGGRPFDLGSLDNASLMEIPGVFSLSDDLTLANALEKRLQVLGY